MFDTTPVDMYFDIEGEIPLNLVSLNPETEEHVTSYVLDWNSGQGGGIFTEVYVYEDGHVEVVDEDAGFDLQTIDTDEYPSLSAVAELVIRHNWEEAQGCVVHVIDKARHDELMKDWE